MSCVDIEISIDDVGHRFVRCTVHGKVDPEEFERLLKSIQTSVEALKQRRLLLDLLLVTGNLRIPEQFHLGIRSFDAFRGFSRVAVLQKTRPNDGFGALVAKNRGLAIEVFSTEDAATTWLTR
jgi:hypothetical protein